MHTTQQNLSVSSTVLDPAARVLGANQPSKFWGFYVAIAKNTWELIHIHLTPIDVRHEDTTWHSNPCLQYVNYVRVVVFTNDKSTTTYHDGHALVHM